MDDFTTVVERLDLIHMVWRFLEETEDVFRTTHGGDRYYITLGDIKANALTRLQQVRTVRRQDQQLL